MFYFDALLRIVFYTNDWELTATDLMKRFYGTDLLLFCIYVCLCCWVRLARSCVKDRTVRLVNVIKRHVHVCLHVTMWMELISYGTFGNYSIVSIWLQGVWCWIKSILKSMKSEYSMTLSSLHKFQNICDFLFYSQYSIKFENLFDNYSDDILKLNNAPSDESECSYSNHCTRSVNEYIWL